MGRPREALLGHTDDDFFPAEEAAFFRQKDREALTSPEVIDIPEEPMQTPTGTRWLHTRKVTVRGPDGQPTHLLGISSDITERQAQGEELRLSRLDLERRVEERTALLRSEIDERKKAERALRRSEEQLRHSQKMEAVGRLAGGIAHDFNNLLAVVLSYAGLGIRSLAEGDPLRHDLEEIEKAGERAAALTRQLLAFSRQQVLETRRVDLFRIVEGMERMLRRVIGEDVALSTASDPDLYSIRVDPGQIEQVIMNLVVNARDAMPRGGELTLETRNIRLDAEHARQHLGVEPGEYVCLAVTDTGTGMDRETRSRIFEPFFTTKPSGKGSGLGLGLATVFGIVRQSRGNIWVYSEPDKGTTFKIYFPKDTSGDTPTEPRVEVVDLRGREVVLLVEDDAQVRTLARTILQKYGYRVLSAADADEAMQIADSEPGPIDLLLSDVVMPKASGVELARRLSATRPEVLVLCMSGYTDEAVVNHGLVGSDIRFLQKPFTVEALLRKVREVLQSRR